MSHGTSSLKERLVDRLSRSLFRTLAPVLDSFPCWAACLCVLLFPLAVGLCFSATYIFSFLYGLFGSHPLPSREIFLFFPGLDAVFAQTSSLAKALLAYAFAGFILSGVLQRERQPEFGRRFLTFLAKNWNLISALIIFSLLFGTLGDAQFSYYSGNNGALAGLIPYQDANGHYSHYIKYFYDGVMGDWVLRRPLAAFLGSSIHWLAGNSPATALLLRCLLIACAMWASCAVMNRSFGIWSALGCLALEYTYICEYLHTFFTESLGFFWGCMAAALWLQGLREKRLFWDLAAFSVTLVGLLTRMGAMFLVPTLFLYVLWKWRSLYPGHGWWKKPLLGLCLCTAVIVLLNTTFAGRGVGDSQETGSNFSYTFAGLTVGLDWNRARSLYMDHLRTLKTEKEKSRYVYQQGINNLLRSPEIFFKRLAQGEGEFLKRINFFLFHSWYLVSLFGALLVVRRKTFFSTSSAAFWLCVWTGILLSIPFFYFDASWRVNIFAYPFIACFLSLALAQRQAASSTGSSAEAAPWCAMTLSCALLLLMTSVALFPRLHTSEKIARIQAYAASLPEGNIPLVEEGGMGFLVVPDGAEPDPSIPSMTWATFKDRYKKFSYARGEDLFPAGFPKPPFVVLDQIPVVGSPAASGYFIAPPHVLDQKNVLLWNFKVSEQLRDKHTRLRWKIVDQAQPALYK